jgi:hypothetical protein
LGSKDRGIVCIPTTLFSQIRRPSSPSPIQRSTPIRTDQNDLHNLVLTDTPTDPALPAPYKGRPLHVPTKTIFTTLFSQIRRPSSPSPIQRSTPIRTDQNNLNNLALTDTPTQLSQSNTKVDPYTYRPKRSSQSCSRRYAGPALPVPMQKPTHTFTDLNHSNHLVLTDTPTQLSQPHTKVDPYTYRPKRS